MRKNRIPRKEIDEQWWTRSLAEHTNPISSENDRSKRRRNREEIHPWMNIQTPESKFILGSNELEDGTKGQWNFFLSGYWCYPKEEIEEEKDIEDQIDLLRWTV